MMQSVQVIIERLKTNPEDFFGDSEHRGRAPKFMGIAEKLDDLLSHKQEGFIHRLWYLNEDEKEALIEAYRDARRARFEAQVFHDLLSPQEEEPSTTAYTANLAKSMMNAKHQVTNSIIAPQNMINAATKILSDEFDKAYAKNRNT
jgi:hypothetical protein